MKKTALLVLIVNMFLLMTFDVLTEYISMKERTQDIEASVRNSLNSSINTVLSSEEFFSESSVYLSKTSSSAQISVWNGDSFTVGNLYLISDYMNEHDGVVPTQAQYNSKASRISDKERYVYSLMYGDIGTRQPNTKFKNFFNQMGQYCTSTMSIRNIDTRKFEVKTFPSLARMGLELDDVCNSSSFGYSIGLDNQFQSPVNTGVYGFGYYLTPASLGVTYLDEDLLRNTMKCTLDMKVRCDKVSNTTDADFKSADALLDTQVYATGASGTAEKQRNGADHKIVNDGYVEYFLDTLDVDVTYYLVDWWDDSNWEIVSYIEGTPVGVSPTTLPSMLKAKSTQRNKGDHYYVVVAKVDVSVELSIPHQSWVLQWNRYRTTKDEGTEYYGVLNIDESGTMSKGDTGLVYKYSTFCAVTE